MGKLKPLLLLCFSVCTFMLNAQNNAVLNIEKDRTIEGNFSKFYVDNLGNFYVLINDNVQIKKLSSTGDSLQISDNLNQYGNIYSMDVSNPLKIILYYRDFGTILILDRFLNTVGTIDLKQLGIFQTRAVANSYDSQIWLYDEQNAQIKKTDVNGNITFTSTDLRNVFDDAPDPSQIFDNNGMLYLYDKNIGWLLFDYYGAFKQKLAYKNWSDVCVVNNILFGRTSDTLWMYNPKQFVAQSFKTSMNIDFEKIRQITFSGSKMYILNKNGIDVYNIKQ